ncbi:protein farnesyltransferase alpha subunit [Angomonas deanei]|nr:protein farnesyltransferase alpha subunit [Angomonas deanei]|eukprot:EPY37407.1 protein farnesyltransferase alpha subunit [Angomonas deanei]
MTDRESVSSSSCSSYPSTAASPAEIQLHLLTYVDVMGLYLDGVEPAPEPNVHGHPVVKLEFTEPFDKIIGSYRALRKPSQQLLAAATKNASSAATLLGGGVAARWFLLLAFGLRQCTSHYTMWRDRREVVLNETALGYATVGELKKHNIPLHHTVPANLLEEVQSVWLPSREQLSVVHPDGREVYPDVWKGVQWELRTIACVATLYHKNFQVWHHRRELIMGALKTITPDEKRETLLTSETALDEYLQQEHQIQFSDIDERTITHTVFAEVDAKNYHVWLHRTWFIREFRFLTQLPDRESWRTYCATPPDGDDTDEEERGPLRSLSPCPLRDELNLTTTLISKDCFNNSAWCHRYMLISVHVVSPLAEESSYDLLRSVCEREVYFAIRWAAREVTNECSVMYAVSVATLFQQTVVSARGTTVEGYMDSQALLLKTLLLLQQRIVPLNETCRKAAHDLLCNADQRKTEMETFYETKTQFSLDALDTVYAALYAGCYSFVRRTWQFFSEEERQTIVAERPPELYARGGVSCDLLRTYEWVEQLELYSSVGGTTAAERTTEHLIQLYLLHEAMALGLAKRLEKVDYVRSKHWKKEIATLLFREYE